MPPDPYEQAFFATVGARALITATSLGVWDALAEEPLDAPGLAARLGLQERGAEVLLVALQSLGYVRAAGPRFELHPEAARLLVSSSPESQAAFVGPQSALHWDTLGQLDEVMRTGRPAGWHDRPPGDPLWEAYIRGLHAISRGEHDGNAALVPVERPRTLLDLAGGHGEFAMAMCRRHPELRATVLDLPASVEVGRQIVEEQGFSDRVSFSAGDALRDDLGSDLDVISAFNLVHHLAPEQNRALMERARAALRPGGWVVIGETERPEPGAEVHQGGALSGLLFYAISGACTYSRAEMTEWLAEAGFADLRVHRNDRSPWRVVLLGRA